MAYNVKILLDSLSPAGVRLTTWELTYPRMIHCELMTHREFGKNAASSRAIPIEKVIQRVLEDPAMPVWWGKNQSGMQALEELDLAGKIAAMDIWLAARDKAVEQARRMVAFGVHKQIVNRLLEPWCWMTVIMSGTNHAHFFKLRAHKDAQPEFQKLAYMMKERYQASTPQRLGAGEWHMPLIQDQDRLIAAGTGDLAKISVGRCARVSYLTHDGQRDHAADIELHDRLLTSGHWSPFEHVAQTLPDADLHAECGNYRRGWFQYRKTFENEYVAA